MSELSRLSPQPLWDIFAKICSIPHPSYHEESLAKYIVEWTKEKGIYAERDGVGNILLRKPATKGMENRKAVALQAHLDMVPQKNNDTVHNFTKDPIQPFIEDGWVKAHGTTLGSDNGIGMASTLAVLTDDSVEHGPLEVLLTINEENGMAGAFGLQPKWLQSEILINTDSETEGEIYMGCAGGVDFNATLPLNREAVPVDLIALKLTLKGLKGGHSGTEIHLGLGNAIKLMARFLTNNAETLGLRMLDFTGGTLINAIPREATVTLAIAADKASALKAAAQEFLTAIRLELPGVEKKIALVVELTESNAQVLTLETQSKFIALLNATPNGVIHASSNVQGVVETSLNVGVVAMADDKVVINSLIRSITDSSREYVVSMLNSLSELTGARSLAKDNYSGWKPEPNSPIITLARETYQKLFNKTPNMTVVHAGLECGLFKKLYPDVDMVSIGPTITGPHSPNEQVEIVSVELYWKLLTTLLKAIPVCG